MHKYNFILFLIFCSVTLSYSAEAYDTFPPWDFTSREIHRVSPDKELSLPASLLKGGVMMFSKYISPVDGDRCPMYPTCSVYGKEAVEKHGFFIGILMTADRLIHEGNEMDTAPLIKIGDRLRYLDPVSNNDFWWH